MYIKYQRKLVHNYIPESDVEFSVSLEPIPFLLGNLVKLLPLGEWTDVKEDRLLVGE